MFLQDFKINHNEIRILPRDLFSNMRHLYKLDISKNGIVELPDNIYLLEQVIILLFDIIFFEKKTNCLTLWVLGLDLLEQVIL